VYLKKYLKKLRSLLDGWPLIASAFIKIESNAIWMRSLCVVTVGVRMRMDFMLSLIKYQ
jgi:hypothetical protein